MDNNKYKKDVLDKVLDNVLNVVSYDCDNIKCESCPLYLSDKILINNKVTDNTHEIIKCDCLVWLIGYVKELL